MLTAPAIDDRKKKTVIVQLVQFQAHTVRASHICSIIIMELRTKKHRKALKKKSKKTVKIVRAKEFVDDRNIFSCM